VETLDEKDICVYCDKTAIYTDLGINKKGMFEVIDVCKCHLRTYAP